MLFIRLDGGTKVVDMDRGTQEELMDAYGKGRSQQASAIASLVHLWRHIPLDEDATS